MRRSDHPNRPSAITCCFLSSLKTLLTLTQGNSRVRINVLDQTFVGRFSSDNHWPHLSDYRGPGEVVEAVPIVVSGNPKQSRICTSHIERQNLTMRMQMR